MAITKATVTLVGDSNEAKIELIVDTGSILTWVRGERLKRIGFKPRVQKEFRTIEGSVIRRGTGPATIRYDGTDAYIEVVHGEEKDAGVLGVTALESLGLQIDPVTKEIHRSSLLAL